jgi:hypothetical protein
LGSSNTTTRGFAGRGANRDPRRAGPKLSNNIVIEISLLEVSSIQGNYMGSLSYSKGGARSKTLEWEVIGIFCLARVIEFIFARSGLRIRGPSC